MENIIKRPGRNLLLKTATRRRIILDFLYFLIFLVILPGYSLTVKAQTVRPIYEDARQNTDSMYRLPLVRVIGMIEERFHVKIRYPEQLVKDKWVRYAFWRFRPTLEETFEKVLGPLDLKVNPDGKDKYELKPYEFYRWPVKEGWAQLDAIASQYHDRVSWEKRKDSVRRELYAAVGLWPMPARPSTPIHLTALRKYKDYTVRNFALEILPGLYLNGSVYQPTQGSYKGKLPVLLSPDGHWAEQRYRKDCQIRCATLAKLGVMAISYDLFAWGESLLQFQSEDHRKSLSITVQTLGAIRLLDYVSSLKNIDSTRIGISGGSGGGSHTVLMAAMDPRIKLSAPVVSVSSYFYGGCPCESGRGIHECGGGTDNVELAAMAAPHPQLLISDGSDWTAHMPEHDFPYLQKIYGYYSRKDRVSNVHLPEDRHDFGPTKRWPLYRFVAKYFHLPIQRIETNGQIDESFVQIEPKEAMYAFGDQGQELPKGAIKGYNQLVKVYNAAMAAALEYSAQQIRQL